MYIKYIIVKKIGGKNYYFACTHENSIFFDSPLKEAILYNERQTAELKLAQIKKMSPDGYFYIQKITITIEFN